MVRTPQKRPHTVEAPGPGAPAAPGSEASREPEGSSQPGTSDPSWGGAGQWSTTGRQESCHGPARLPEPVRHPWGLGSQNPQRCQCLKAKQLSSEPSPSTRHPHTRHPSTPPQTRARALSLLESSTPQLTSMTPGIHVRVVNS